MKKKIFLTSLMLAAGALVLASCGNKKVVSENTDITETNNSTENNSGENQNENTDVIETFFDENSFVLPENFNEKNLKYADLSLKQQILLDISHSYYPTSYEGYAYYSEGVVVNGQVYNPSAKTYIKTNLYSNDVYENKTDYFYDDDNMPSYNSGLPYRSIEDDSSLRVLSSTPSVRGSYSFDDFGPSYSYSAAETIALTENYSFRNEIFTELDYKDNSFTVGNRSSYDLQSRLYNSIPEGPMSYFYMPNQTYYQYDETHIVAVASSSDSMVSEIPVKYDSNTDTLIYEDYYCAMTQKTITVFEITEDSFDLVFGCDLFEEKASHIYDEDTDLGVSLGGIKPIHTYKSFMKISTKEIEYENKDEFINSFRATSYARQINADYYVSQYDASNNLTIGNVADSNSAKYNFLSEKDGVYNFECAYNISKGDVTQLKANLVYKLLNSKVLNDEKLSSSEEEYTTVSNEFVLDIDEKYLPEKVEIIEQNNQKYLACNLEDYSNYYAVIFNVSASVNENNEIEVTINNVEFVLLEDSLIVIR